MRLPAEVYDYVRNVFAECNSRVAAKMTRIPTVHETSLDITLIEALSHFAAPSRVGRDWTVRLDTHYLGGGRHFGQWEIADIGLIVVWRDQGRVRLRKVALLQSKRLYPDEQLFEEDVPLDYMIGFARLMQGDEQEFGAQADREFSFTPDSRFRALPVGDGQWEAIADYEERYSIPVHYLLYHPLAIPWQQRIPLQTRRRLPSNELGARVARASDLHKSMAGNKAGHTPTVAELSTLQQWRLELFVADELLRCREGYRAEGPEDDGLFQVFNRRTGPISAAISITIDRHRQ